MTNIYSKKNSPSGFYVYAYIRGKDSKIAKAGTPYYIGKGQNKRAWSTDHSIKLPKNKENIIILEANLSEIGAFALERRLIKWWGRADLNNGILRNRTDGGEGASNRINQGLYGSTNPSYDSTVYTFYHDDGKIEFATQYDFRIKYNLNGANLSEVIHGNQKSIKGWRITRDKATNTLGMNHPSFNKIHTFYHESGVKEICKKIELSSKYNISLKSLGQLIRGNIKTLHGWRMSEDKIVHGKVDTNIYCFVNTDNIEIKCSKDELIKKFNIPRSTLNAVMRKEKGYTLAKGWRLK